MTDSYDIIGDIHGHADELKALLETMDYTFTDGSYRHSSRKALFLGDFIDRGPMQREVLQTVMPMVQQGAALAIMGNHELNALSYHMQHPDKPGVWLRPRNDKNTQQHLAFLHEYLGGQREAELADVLAFFRSLPLWLDLGGLRAVHACWAPGKAEALVPYLNPDNTLTHELLVQVSEKQEPAYDAVESLLKGVEYPLPDGKCFVDKDGHKRFEVRIQWWHNEGCRLGDITFPPGILDDETSGLPVSADDLVGYPAHEKPLFLGHYWLNGTPGKLADNIACLDYSVAKGGILVAYRWDGETTLDNNKFVWA